MNKLGMVFVSLFVLCGGIAVAKAELLYDLSPQPMERSATAYEAANPSNTVAVAFGNIGVGGDIGTITFDGVVTNYDAPTGKYFSSGGEVIINPVDNPLIGRTELAVSYIEHPEWGIDVPYFVDWAPADL